MDEYPSNRPVSNALVARQEAGPDHAVIAYTGENLARPELGPVNPFKDPSSLKRKGVNNAQEVFISDHTFRSKHRAVERAGGPEREYLSGRQMKEQAARMRTEREEKGNALVSDGVGAYVGPWAKSEYESVEVDRSSDLGSDVEYEVVDEEQEVVASGTIIRAPDRSLARRKELEEQGAETTNFHGESEHDYQGRTYMHVPQDLDVSLRKEVGSTTNFIPKKLVYTWKLSGSKAVTALRLFPGSSHLGLAATSNGLVRIFDLFHQRAVLRTFSGHTKAVSDLSFNRDGTRFASGSFDRSVKIWDTETGACLSRLRPGKTTNVLAFCPAADHGHELLAGLSDNRIVQYDSRVGGEAATVQEYTNHLGPINTIEYVDDNRRFMSTSDDRSLRVWEYGIPVEIKIISEPDMFALTKSCRNPNGKSVFYQADNQVLVYSSTDRFRQNRKKSYRGHISAGSGIGLACSPDGQFLASGDAGGYVCFWDVKTCKMYNKLQADGAGGSVNHVVWSEQETSKVLTAGAKGEIKLWD